MPKYPYIYNTISFLKKLLYIVILLSPLLSRGQDKTDTLFYPNKKIKSITITKGKTKSTRHFWESGKLQQEATYKNDTLDGVRKMWYGSGQLQKESFYEMGQLKGASKTFYEDGDPQEVSTYTIIKVNGRPRSVMDGVQKNYSPGGKPQKEVNYKEGKKEGVEAEWYASGTKKRETTFKGDHKMGPYSYWNEGGNLMAKGAYDTLQKLNYNKEPRIDEVKTGYWETWYASGKKQSEGKFSKNKKLGKHTEWYENGNKNGEAEYKDDHLNGETKRWYKNGQLQWAQTMYARYDSVKKYFATYNEGKYEEYEEGGGPKKMGQYKAGKKTGKWQYYNQGSLVEDAEYDKDGRLIGKHTLYFSNKNISKVEYYKASKIKSRDTTLLDGEVTDYHDNGKIRALAVYKQGILQPPGVKTFTKSGHAEQELIEDATSILKIDYFENGSKQRESRALKDPKVETKDLKYYTEKMYDNKGTLRMQISHKEGRACGYMADYNEDGMLIGEAMMLNFKGDYPVVGNIDNSWQSLYYYNGNPWKEVYVKQSWGIGYEIEWYITGTLKRYLLTNKYDIQWSQYGEVMSAVFYDPKRHGEVLDTTLSKEWIDNLYKKCSASKNKMLRVGDAKDGMQRSYYDDKQVRFEAAIKNHSFDSIFRGYYPDGKLFVEWQLKEGTPHGKYTLMNANGTLFESGHFSNGKTDGTWIMHNAEGKPYEEFEYDTTDVKGRNYVYKKEYYTETGAPKSSSHYRNGKQYGLQQQWHKNGKLSYQYESRNDTTVGLYETWSENGLPNRKTTYVNGKQEGPDEGWHDNGKKYYEQFYVKGKKDGPSKGWWKNGKLRYNGYYKIEERDSLWITYDSTGKELTRNLYKKGVSQNKPTKLPCYCSEEERKIGFAPTLENLVDTTNLDKWQFNYHEKIDKGLKHLFYMDLQFSSSSSGRARFNGFTVIAYKKIEVGFPDKKGLKLVLNPCFSSGASQVGINASLETGNPDATRLEIQPHKLAFKFDTKLLKPLNTELKECLAYFTVDFMEYEEKGITLHKPASACFTPCEVGKTKTSLEVNDFIPAVTGSSKTYTPGYGGPDAFSDLLNKQMEKKFTGIVAGTGNLACTFQGKNLKFNVSSVTANNDFVALVLTEKILIADQKIALKNNGVTLNTSEEELKNYFTKAGYSTVITAIDKGKGTLTIKILYKK